MFKKYFKIFLLPILSIFLFACDIVETSLDEYLSTNEAISQVEEDTAYDTVQEVVDYLDKYEKLPPNYLTKKEAQELGWNAKEGNLWEVAPDSSIGGDYFGNFEGKLPDENGRNYHEADIEYEGGYRNEKRLIYSNDYLYFYTDDHYETFEEIEPSGDNQ